LVNKNLQPVEGFGVCLNELGSISPEESTPPDGPNEVMNTAPVYLNNNPFKTNQG
jgi:hypothetical protein